MFGNILNQIDQIMAGVVAYLLIVGGITLTLGSRMPTVRQHQLAFVTMFVLILGGIPQLQLSMVAPGIISSFGLLLLALHVSAYY